MFRKLAVLFLAFATFGIIAVPNALAERSLMIFKTNVPLEVPGRVLAPGTYSLVKLNGIANNGPIAIQTLRGKFLGQYVMQPIARVHVEPHQVLKLQKQAHAPARIDYFVQAGRMDGYQFMYARPPMNPIGISVAKDVPLSQIERRKG
jgi:hypothetical protein